MALNADQQKALEEILAALQPASRTDKDRLAPAPILLQGVTGSGKTEVYLQAIAHVLERRQSAIVLVPEISLTPQTIDRFQSRFSVMRDQIAVLHSHLSAGERFDEWDKLRRQPFSVAIGARSAIFAPVRRLGLIIVDEEHEPSYKQDKQPRYNARDLAVVRASIEGAGVVLGSATPSLESWHNARLGRYRHLHLPVRADNRQLPVVFVDDMRKRRPSAADPAMQFLSPRLRQGIDRRLELGEQVILFLNRRGYATSLICPACGHVEHCSHCSICAIAIRVPEQCAIHDIYCPHMYWEGTVSAAEAVAELARIKPGPISDKDFNYLLFLLRNYPETHPGEIAMEVVQAAEDSCADEPHTDGTE
jgi:primosomal protein N' (replication factor Y)